METAVSYGFIPIHGIRTTSSLNFFFLNRNITSLITDVAKSTLTTTPSKRFSFYELSFTNKAVQCTEPDIRIPTRTSIEYLI